jgi:hypothetical protein
MDGSATRQVIVPYNLEAVVLIAVEYVSRGLIRRCESL